MIKELINSTTNFNLILGTIGGVLVIALDKPLGYAIIGGRVWSSWPLSLETACCSVEYGAVQGPRCYIESLVYWKLLVHQDSVI